MILSALSSYYACFRVIPMIIILYRYLMVCRVDFCLKLGEKKLCEILLRICWVLPTFMASLALFYSDNMRGFIMCTGREEILRFNTNNFLEDVSYDESLMTLPFHHPYKILRVLLGKKKI